MTKKETKVEITLKSISIAFLYNKKIFPDVTIFHVSMKQNLQELEEFVKNTINSRISLSSENKKI